MTDELLRVQDSSAAAGLGSEGRRGGGPTPRKGYFRLLVTQSHFSRMFAVTLLALPMFSLRIC